MFNRLNNAVNYNDLISFIINICQILKKKINFCHPKNNLWQLIDKERQMSSIENLKFVLKSIRDSGTFDSDVLERLTKSEREIVGSIYDENLVSEALMFLEDLDTDDEWGKLIGKMTSSKKPVVPLWKSILKYAAIFAGFVVISYLVYQFHSVEIEIPISETAIKLKIGGDKVKVIQEGESQEIISMTGKILGVQKGNKISYKGGQEIKELIYNELEIPFGKTFDVELSDGTMVHLNSGTKMRYPVKFLNSGKREVFIEGEAYFIVAKDKDHPFVVHADEVAVEVLGTIFNISSYNEDAEINTVLVEGSVKMSNAITPNDDVMLKPGSKGSWHKADYSISVEKGRSDRQVAFSTEPVGEHTAAFSVGIRKRDVYLTPLDKERAERWRSEGHSESMRTPDSTLIFVTSERMKIIRKDQVDCMGCLSHCKFSNWAEGGNNSTGHKADPRSFCIQKTLQDIVHDHSDVDSNLMFAGHGAYRFATDPFYANGFVPTVKQLVERIMTGK